jgi:hypothetical protein
MSTDELIGKRESSYINHITHIQNIPNPEQIQYMNYTHAIAWSFNKDKKCKKNIYNNLYYSKTKLR